MLAHDPAIAPTLMQVFPRSLRQRTTPVRKLQQPTIDVDGISIYTQSVILTQPCWNAPLTNCSGAHCRTSKMSPFCQVSFPRARSRIIDSKTTHVRWKINGCAVPASTETTPNQNHTPGSPATMLTKMTTLGFVFSLWFQTMCVLTPW